MTLREFNVNDVSALDDAKNFGFSDGWSESMILSAINSGNFYGFIAEGESIQGFITYTLTIDFAEVADVFVFPEFRKTGVGTALLIKLIDFVKNSGRKKIFLEVRKGNLAAKNLYIKLGFTEIYERKKYYGDEDASVMVKEI